MKDVLIVCYGMGCGGAEKSLISFLNRLPKDRWNVDLIVANPNGMYMKQIPSTVHFLNNQYELENFATPMSLRLDKSSKLANKIKIFMQKSKLEREKMGTMGETSAKAQKKI